MLTDITEWDEPTLEEIVEQQQMHLRMLEASNLSLEIQIKEKQRQLHERHRQLDLKVEELAALLEEPLLLTRRELKKAIRELVRECFRSRTPRELFTKLPVLVFGAWQLFRGVLYMRQFLRRT